MVLSRDRETSFGPKLKRRRCYSERKGVEQAAQHYTLGPARVQLQNKDPRGWRQFADQMTEHSARGAALTLRGVQGERPSLWELVDDMRRIESPTLIITGDEDEPCLEPALLMKRSDFDRRPAGAAALGSHHQLGGARGLQLCLA